MISSETGSLSISARCLLQRRFRRDPRGGRGGKADINHQRAGGVDA